LILEKYCYKILNMMSKVATTPRTYSENHPLVRRIACLRRERDQLEEEVQQLRAAIRIWTEVGRHTMQTAAVNVFDAEMR
jgi:hypothetical protein